MVEKKSTKKKAAGKKPIAKRKTRATKGAVKKKAASGKASGKKGSASAVPPLVDVPEDVLVGSLVDMLMAGWSRPELSAHLVGDGIVDTDAVLKKVDDAMCSAEGVEDPVLAFHLMARRRLYRAMNAAEEFKDAHLVLKDMGALVDLYGDVKRGKALAQLGVDFGEGVDHAAR